MTTTQQTLNSPASPSPRSVPPDPFLNEDHNNAVNPEPHPVNEDPARCRFLSSDKRRCRMLRADHHPDFCLYHAARQEEIFALLPEREFSLAPELEPLAADLTTATGVNRALGEVFRLLAQNRITRKDAVAFGYLAQLLLQTVPGVRAEAVSAFGQKAWQENLKVRLGPEGSAAKVYPPAANVYPQDELRGAHKVELSPLNQVNLASKLVPVSLSSPATNHSERESAVADELKRAAADPSRIGILSEQRESKGADDSLPQPTPSASSSRPTNGSEASTSSRSIPKETSPIAVHPPNSVDATIAANASATSAFSRPDYTDLLTRSVDLLDGKFDAAPESQSETRRLLRDLERLTPARRVTPAESTLPPIAPQLAQNVQLQNHWS